MTTLQEHRTTLAEQAQKADEAMIDVWTRWLVNTAVRLPVVTGRAATHELVAQAFDITMAIAHVQRSVVTQMANTAICAAESFAQTSTNALMGAAGSGSSSGRTRRTAK